MHQRSVAAVVFAGLLYGNAVASEAEKILFVDGRWHGSITTVPNSPDFECRASTTFADGTTFALAERQGGNWRLELSNPDWRLRQLRRYALFAQVDFYPRLQVEAIARKQTVLEIVDLDRISLLGLIENGHTLDLISEDFTDKYELEGSAKVIARIRNCVADG